MVFLQALKQPFKIFLIGPSTVGKSSYLEMLQHGYISGNHVKSINPKIHLLRFKTDRRNVIDFKIWDCPDQKRFFDMTNYNFDKNKAIDGFIYMTSERFEGDEVEVDYENLKRHGIPIVTTKNEFEMLDERYMKTIDNECYIIDDGEQIFNPKLTQLNSTISVINSKNILDPLRCLGEILTGQRYWEFKQINHKVL